MFQNHNMATPSHPGGETPGARPVALGPRSEFGVSFCINHCSADWEDFPLFSLPGFSRVPPLRLPNCTPQNRSFWRNPNDRIILADLANSVNWDKWINRKCCNI
jgi:hypothetical protein